jgi:hypothetical protein
MIRTDLNVHYKELSSQKVLRVQGFEWREAMDGVKRCLGMAGTQKVSTGLIQTVSEGDESGVKSASLGLRNPRILFINETGEEPK